MQIKFGFSALLAMFTALLLLLTGTIGCSQSDRPMEMRDVAAAAYIAGATGGELTVQIQNRPGEVYSRQAFGFDSGIDAAINLQFDGGDVDLDALLEFIHGYPVLPPDSGV